MRMRIATLLAAALLASTTTISAQPAPEGAAAGKPAAQAFRTRYVRLGFVGDGLLYEPTGAADPAKARIALVFTHPGGDNFTYPLTPGIVARGYRVMNVNSRSNPEMGSDWQFPAVSMAIDYLRKLPGVQKVIVIGHSGGAHELALYANVAANGQAACAGPEKIYPCRAPGLDNLQKPDGVILVDPPLGAFHAASSLDPADSQGVNRRDPSLDMFSPANGFGTPPGKATYSPEFIKRFYAAQAARNSALLAHALGRLKAIEAGNGDFANDEPITIPGMGVATGGARLFQSDSTLMNHTREPHILLKADGTRSMEIIRSVRGGMPGAAKQVRELGAASQTTTIRGYLATEAIRLRPDYAITEDDIVGVDWSSAYENPVGNAPGIKVPTLVMSMTCHYLMVPAEKIYDSLGATDKTYAAVEGSTHMFTACKPEYGDTSKRLYDFIDEWLQKPGRF